MKQMKDFMKEILITKKIKLLQNMIRNLILWIKNSTTQPRIFCYEKFSRFKIIF